VNYTPIRISKTFWKRSDINLDDKALYTVLRSYQDENGRCVPTISELVSSTGLSPSGLRLRLLAVRKRGIVDWHYEGNTRVFTFRERLSENGEPVGYQQNDSLPSGVL